MEKTSNNATMSSSSTEWGTPQPIVDNLEQAFGRFDLDPAATNENHKAPQWYTKVENGLVRPWYGRVFLNPPYGRSISDWIDKVRSEVCTNNGPRHVVAILPARTDTQWWTRAEATASEIHYVTGRISFEREGKTYGAPFPSAILVWRKASLYRFGRRISPLISRISAKKLME